MRGNYETTATQLHVLLTACEITISLSTILLSRSILGWTFRGSKYYQLIRDQKKEKRLQWAKQYSPEAIPISFFDVIWTDECSVQLESHRRHSYRKKGEHAVLKPCPKHPTKVHIWAGISRLGTTPIVIFEGTIIIVWMLHFTSKSYGRVYCHSFDHTTHSHTS